MMNLSQEKEGGKAEEKTNSEQDNAAPSEDGRTYGTDRLNLGKPSNDLESDSKRVLA